MRRNLIIPALLIAAVVPFFLIDRDWPQRLQHTLSPMPAQIGSSNGTSNAPSHGFDFSGESRGSPTPTQSSPSTPFGSSPTTGNGYSTSPSGDRGTRSTPTTTASGATSSHTSAYASSPVTASAEVAIEPSVEGPPVHNLTEVFRFDVTPRWVTGRWPRVSTVLSESHLEGLRVPLVTGKAPDDLAGSLTYYFDKQHVVQRLTFHGYTGDDTRIVALVTQKNIGLKPVPTLGAGLYLLSWGSKPRSALRVSLAPVVRAGDIHRRLEVMLEINRPRSYYAMSPDFEKLLEQDRANARW